MAAPPRAELVALDAEARAAARAPLAFDARSPALPAWPASRRPIAISVADPALLAEAYFHALGTGNCPLLVNPLLPLERRRLLARKAGALALIADGSQVELLEADGPGLPAVGHLLSTSGTTGEHPRIFFFDERVARENARAHLFSLGAGGGERALLPMSMSHGFGLVAGALGCAGSGSALFAFRATPDPASLLAALQAHGITLAYLTPPLARMLLRRCRRHAPPPLPDLRRVSIGSATISRGELRELMAFFPGVRFFFTYGLTELGPRVTTFAAGTDEEPAAALGVEPNRSVPVGLPLAGVGIEVRDTDATGAGALFVRSPFASAGRWDAGRLAPFEGGAVATHDAARLLADGTLEVLGRTDGTVVMGGSNIYPGDVEGVADAVDGIAASCLVGRPSPVYGEVPVLVCEVAGDAEAALGALRQRLSRELPATSMPVEIRVVPSLPRTALGKVQRAWVRALVAA